MATVGWWVGICVKAEATVSKWLDCNAWGWVNQFSIVFLVGLGMAIARLARESPYITNVPIFLGWYSHCCRPIIILTCQGSGLKVRYFDNYSVLWSVMVIRMGVAWSSTCCLEGVTAWFPAHLRTEWPGSFTHSLRKRSSRRNVHNFRFSWSNINMTMNHLFWFWFQHPVLTQSSHSIHWDGFQPNQL